MSGFDTPETIKEDSDLKLTLMRFCYGFGVDESGGFYYALNTFESASPDDSGSYILYFNEKQELAKKIYLKTEGETVVARNLLIPRGHARYGIGTTKEKILLFKF